MKNSISSIFENSLYDYREIISSKNIETELTKLFKCQKCYNINLKKFKPINEQINLNEINNKFGKCVCGRRHLDIAMAHVLKIMIEEDLPLRKHTLRDGAVPLLTPFTSSPNEHNYVGKDSLVILHPYLNKKVANIIIKEVDEVKSVLKGYPNDTVGIKEQKSEPITYELLGGSDIRCDIVKTPINPSTETTNEERIAINKIQHLTYLEFPPSIENKIKILDNYFKSKNIPDEKLANLTILDGTCGNGSLGIFLLKKRVKKVIFNDIWKPATFMTSVNLEANGFKTKLIDFKDIFNFDKNVKDNKNIEKSKNNDIISRGNNFKVYNLAIEDLKEKLSIEKENKFDICILDCFPSVNTDNFEKIANSLAKNVLTI
jgi:hypothetical protein